MAPARQRGGSVARMRSIVRLVGVALTAAAVLTELSRPAEQRSWHGRLGGWVPYDLRRPTVARLRQSLWAPDDPRRMLPRAFGVGWSPNLARLRRSHHSTGSSQQDTDAHL